MLFNVEVSTLLAFSSLDASQHNGLQLSGSLGQTLMMPGPSSGYIISGLDSHLQRMRHLPRTWQVPAPSHVPATPPVVVQVLPELEKLGVHTSAVASHTYLSTQVLVRASHSVPPVVQVTAYR
jgi:hypothetical protein